MGACQSTLACQLLKDNQSNGHSIYPGKQGLKSNNSNKINRNDLISPTGTEATALFSPSYTPRLSFMQHGSLSLTSALFSTTTISQYHNQQQQEQNTNRTEQQPHRKFSFSEFDDDDVSVYDEAPRDENDFYSAVDKIETTSVMNESSSYSDNLFMAQTAGISTVDAKVPDSQPFPGGATTRRSRETLASRQISFLCFRSRFASS